MAGFEPLKGHCTCGSIQYQLSAPPLVVHCCHCTWCQREVGAAFATNAQIEAYNFKITSLEEPIFIQIPSVSGAGQLVARCPTCYTAVYSHNSPRGAIGKAIMFVKIGTLADGSRQRVRPDVHIYTSTKVEWVDLQKEEERGIKVYEGYYQREDVWSESSLQRRTRLLEWLESAKEKGTSPE
ncbi:hypothetical protein BS50DRAFT_309229 [Corynespora cassiicola Philippines]|uniref:CENP-V/GFA domain-containing protein n=1 Tax=Corynespora cassiicola Philippines TaxID=1448308 RepID=A0A2T2NXU9_CORCC|nr:hypothetical protein BS50DRAFT_309229 [Corynespora cassiicola Philippines]